MIAITDRAIDKILQLKAKEPKAQILRVGVRGGGCSGLSYFMEFEEDVRTNDESVEIRGLRVVCDPKSSLYLNGVELDYETSLLKAGFRFSNPNAKKSCSCGESFTV